MAKKVEIRETDFIRWLFYAGFFYCVISLVTSLSNGGIWIGYLLGSVFFGVFAMKAYTLHVDFEQQRSRQTQYVKENPPEQPGTTANSSWDIQGDPAQPPQPQQTRQLERGPQ